MTRTTRRIIPAAIAALGMSVVLGACQEGTPEASPSEASASATASSSPTTSASETLSPEDEATAVAEDMLREYYEVSDQSLQDPKSFDVGDYEEVASTTALSGLQGLHANVVDQGVHQVGETSLVDVEATKVDLSNKPKATPPEVPTVEFRVCYDVSDLNMVDGDGKSVVPADRKPRGVERVGVVNYSYPDEDGWRVDYTEYKEKAKC